MSPPIEYYNRTCIDALPGNYTTCLVKAPKPQTILETMLLVRLCLIVFVATTLFIIPFILYLYRSTIRQLYFTPSYQLLTEVEMLYASTLSKKNRKEFHLKRDNGRGRYPSIKYCNDGLGARQRTMVVEENLDAAPTAEELNRWKSKGGYLGEQAVNVTRLELLMPDQLVQRVSNGADPGIAEPPIALAEEGRAEGGAPEIQLGAMRPPTYSRLWGYTGQAYM